MHVCRSRLIQDNVSVMSRRQPSLLVQITSACGFCKLVSLNKIKLELLPFIMFISKIETTLAFDFNVLHFLFL